MTIKNANMSTQKTPDKKLMQLIAKGDHRAFNELMDHHLLHAFRYAYSLLNDTHKAEDVTQEAFMKAWTHAKTWKPQAEVKNWLFRIARNLSIDEMRKTKPQLPIENAILHDPASGPGRQTNDRQISAIVAQALTELPDRQREALHLVHFLECTNIEAAEIMGISVDAIESLIARGRRKLKDKLMHYKKEFLEDNHDTE